MSSSHTSVDVLICTFRRGSVTETIASIANQQLPENVRLKVIVADNDTTPSAEARVREAAAASAVPVVYVHAPERNISIARNATLAAATGDWVAFIDDDEIADPRWISTLLEEADRSGADVVLGPVRPNYGPDAPNWLVTGDFLATTPTYRGGHIAEGYSCNALLRRTCPAAQDQSFDLALGRSGGEDTDFFDRLIGQGAQIAYAPDAVVTEDVPPDRMQLTWLLRRRYRFGQTHGRILLRQTSGLPGRFRAAALAGTKSAFSLLAAGLNIVRPSRRVFWLMRAALHAGVVSRLVGHSEIIQYGDTGDRAADS